MSEGVIYKLEVGSRPAFGSLLVRRESVQSILARCPLEGACALFTGSIERSGRFTTLLTLFAALLFSATGASAEPTLLAGGAATPSEGYVGIQVCQACHSAETQHWLGTRHAELFLKAPRTSLEERACEACHGPGAGHVADPADPQAILGFTRGGDRSVEEMNASCLQCHTTGPRVHWAGSIHESEALACSDCHNPMARVSPAGLLRERSLNETCFSCHPTQRVDFRKRSRMPLLEGKIDCGDCHQPHGSPNEPLLQGTSRVDLCTSCHASKRGPFIWEHAPVTEDCTTCHLPHGSNRENLLVDSPPFLCQECHSQVGAAHPPASLMSRGNLASGADPIARDPRIMARGCLTCHSQIHGSNHPSGARFHR
jgi:DmsE family decaheme c-type cytochrome